MKMLTIITLFSVTVGCATTEPMRVMKQLERSAMQTNSFCHGDRPKTYIETDYYYQFTCDDGRFFMLPKY